MSKNPNRLDQMLEAEGRLKVLVTEARGVLKDLKDEKQRIVRYIENEPRKIVEEEVTRQLGEMGKQTERAMSASVAKVFAEFDKLQRILLGTGDKGKKDLFELAEEKVKRDKEVG